MIELGMKSKIFGVELLRPIQIYDRPVSMPGLVGEDKVIAGYDQGLGERMIVCDSLEDMQELYDAYSQGLALRLNWYLGNDRGFVQIFVQIYRGIT